MDRNDFIERVIGGILGAITIIAAIIEMVLGGFSAESVVAAIKEISGTAIVIFLLFSFVNEHKKAKGVRGSIENAMMQLEHGYAPLIREATVSNHANENKKAKLDRIVRYEIAVKTDALFGTQCNNFCPFFDIDLDSPTNISFYIRKKFFGESFDAQKIFNQIYPFMTRQHEGLKMTFLPDASGGKAIIEFDQPMKYDKDIQWLISVVDDMIFSYTMIQPR